MKAAFAQAGRLLQRLFLIFVWLAAAPPLCVTAIPVRGLHIFAPKPSEMPLMLRFIREALPREGVNLIVLEIGYSYQFSRRPEVTGPDPLSRSDVRRIVEACRAVGVRVIPEVNLLGHQSTRDGRTALLKAHPEFDETPARNLDNQDVFCRSYCPLHPAVHDVVFDIIDEIAEAFDATAFHTGMDEVYILGEDECPRCRGKRRADLFALEVRTLHDHLAKSGRTMWMWGDRFLNDKTGGIGNPDDPANTTQPAVKSVPKDIVVCDWQYTSADHPTALYLARHGFDVLYCPWRRPAVALRELDIVRSARMNISPIPGNRMIGMLQTTWCDFGSFARAYFGGRVEDPHVREAVRCFRALFRELRKSADARQGTIQ